MDPQWVAAVRRPGWASLPLAMMFAAAADSVHRLMCQATEAHGLSAADDAGVPCRVTGEMIKVYTNNHDVLLLALYHPSRQLHHFVRFTSLTQMTDSLRPFCDLVFCNGHELASRIGAVVCNQPFGVFVLGNRRRRGIKLSTPLIHLIYHEFYLTLFD
jgi:hypothetical protein